MKFLEKYDKNKFHGGLITDAKCLLSWRENNFCLHQFYEIVVRGIEPEFIVKRDFEGGKHDHKRA